MTCDELFCYEIIQLNDQGFIEPLLVACRARIITETDTPEATGGGRESLGLLAVSET